ncbi:MAG: peptidoglycan-binding protein [Bryobacteraceae bacterium]|nr:peptidoglycan-binding protein [Bryobacteraceae bacterium]
MPLEYEVQQGDCIASIAFEYGFFPDTLWNHAENAELKKLRKDPYVLLPGDLVHIPDKRIVEYPRPTEKTHVFKRKGVPEFLTIQLWKDREPRRNIAYTITIDGLTRNGTTDGEGILKYPIPPNAREAVVQLADGNVYTLQLGHLDPVDTIIGVQKRLHALGYFDQAIDGEASGELTEAIREFQQDNGLPETGELDAATRGELQKLVEG